MWAVEFNPNKTVNLDFGTCRRSVSHPKDKFGTDGPTIENVEIPNHLGIFLIFILKVALVQIS